MNFKTIITTIYSRRATVILVMLVLFIFVKNAIEYNILQSFVFMLFLLIPSLLTYLLTQYLLIPKFIEKQQGEGYLLYTVASCFMIFGIMYVCASIESLLSGIMNSLVMERYIGDIRLKYLALVMLTYAISNIIYFVKKFKKENEQKEEVLARNKNMEMEMLKTQINSHFLFNALNNIYSMTYFDNQNASKYIMKLSQMLRYVLEDCETNQVPISSEIKYIENYIDFQKARFEKDRDIVFNYRNEIGDVLVSPMIFQPIIENCFKHCPLQHQNSYIHINIIVEKNQIKFTSENTQTLMKLPIKRSSIGIENMKSRLNILYNNRYILNIEDGNDIYKTELIINI